MDAADDSVRRRQWRTARHELVYFCGEYIKNAETSRARVWLLVHDINFELHPLAVDVQSFDRSAFRDAIKVVRECGSCVISARQLHMPRRFDGHRLCTFPGPVLTSSREALAHPLARQLEISAKWWSEWQDLNLRPPHPERGSLPDPARTCNSISSAWCEHAFLD